MDDSIKIPASHSKYIDQAYREAYTYYLKTKDSLDKEFREMEPILKRLKIIQDAYEFASNDAEALKEARKIIDKQEIKIAILFNALSWFERAQFILQEAGKPLTVNQIADEMSSSFGFDKYLAVKSLSPVLSQAYMKGLIQRGDEKMDGEITYKSQIDGEKYMNIISALHNK